ncbi:MAG: DNA-formamidopyrimidine glycosylase [Bryobacteraceae bacterium]|nr:DNA-formamidopyrimidine glycosylase [Bryobacteraceae bacterium]
MPELPEVEAVVRKLRSRAEGAFISEVRVLRARSTHPQHSALLQSASGRVIDAIDRRGKNIILRLSGSLAIRVHLRMTGNLVMLPSHLLHSQTVRVVFALRDGRGIGFEDPRVLGTVHLHTDSELQEILNDLGVEPLSADFTVSFLASHAKRSHRPVKVFLMEQNVVAGLGNIYAAESLFRARIHPARLACGISQKKVKALHAAIVEVLTEAMTEAEASYSQPGSHNGMSWRVYGREGKPCVVCGQAIRRLRQAARSTYYCAVCQK